MKKKLQYHFIHHLRSYRTFHFMFFSFVLLITSILLSFFWNKIYAGDLLEEAFKPAMTHETIINLWNTKNAVGNEVLREGVGVNIDILQWCEVNWTKINKNKVIEQKEKFLDIIEQKLNFVKMFYDENGKILV